MAGGGTAWVRFGAAPTEGWGVCQTATQTGEDGVLPGPSSASVQGPDGGGPGRSWCHAPGSRGRDALEGKGPQRWPQRWVDRRLEEVAKAVGGSYCRLQKPLRLALAVRGTVAGHRLGALEGRGGGGVLPYFQYIPVQGDR